MMHVLFALEGLCWLKAESTSEGSTLHFDNSKPADPKYRRWVIYGKLRRDISRSSLRGLLNL